MKSRYGRRGNSEADDSLSIPTLISATVPYPLHCLYVLPDIGVEIAADGHAFS
jgi:hypothetical protein